MIPVTEPPAAAAATAWPSRSDATPITSVRAGAAPPPNPSRRAARAITARTIVAGAVAGQGAPRGRLDTPRPLRRIMRLCHAAALGRRSSSSPATEEDDGHGDQDPHWSGTRDPVARMRVHCDRSDRLQIPRARLAKTILTATSLAPGGALGENELTYMEDTWLSQSHVGTHLDGLGHIGRRDCYFNQTPMGKYINQNNMT